MSNTHGRLVPHRVMVLEELARHPAGIGSMALAARINVAGYTVSSILSRLHMYGGPVEMVGRRGGPGTIWRFKPAAKVA